MARPTCWETFTIYVPVPTFSYTLWLPVLWVKYSPFFLFREGNILKILQKHKSLLTYLRNEKWFYLFHFFLSKELFIYWMFLWIRHSLLKFFLQKAQSENQLNVTGGFILEQSIERGTLGQVRFGAWFVSLFSFSSKNVAQVMCSRHFQTLEKPCFTLAYETRYETAVNICCLFFPRSLLVELLNTYIQKCHVHQETNQPEPTLRAECALCQNSLKISMSGNSIVRINKI